MHIFRVLIPAIALMGLWLGIGAQPAAAATLPAPPLQEIIETETNQVTDEFGLHCADEVCALELDLGEDVPYIARIGAPFLVEVLQDNVKILPQGTGIEITDNIVLKMPVGDISVLDADLTVELGEARDVQRLRGTARVPFPAIGLLENVEVDSPALADLGLEWGKNLAYLGAPLIPDRQYLFLNFGTGLDFNVDVPTQSGESRAISFSVPKGQNATLILDPNEPFVYVAGNIMLSDSDQIAFLGDLLNMEAAGLAIGDGLPIRQRTNLHVAGTFTDEWQDTSLHFQGGYAVDSGMLGNWVGLEVTPIAVQGVVTLEDAGLMLAGNLRSEIQPEMLFNSELEARLFVPFPGGVENAYVQFGGNAAVPVARLSTDGRVRLDSSLALAIDSSLSTPFGELSRERVASLPMPVVAPVVSNLAGGVVDSAVGGYRSVQGAAGNGYDWLVDGAGTGANAIADGAGQSWEFTSGAFCRLSGFCNEPADELGAIADAR